MYVDNFSLSRYDTWELDAMLEQIERPNPWLLRTFFPTVKLFDSAAIEFDVMDRGRRMAPFVSPLVAGKPMRLEGYRTQQLKPAYIKPTALVLPQNSFVRRAGEGYGGTMSPQARFDAEVAEHLANHEEMLDNRLEWMAAQALVTGAVTIQGEDYPAVSVNFGRDASLSIVLSGTARWTQTTSNPMGDIEANSIAVRKMSKGAIVTDLVMDGLAWSALRAHASVNDIINVFYRRSLAGQAPASVDTAPRNNINEAQYVGTLNGRIDLWVYDAYYEDDTGASQPYLPAYTVLGLSRALEGRQYFGAIMDIDAGIQPRRLFSKSKVRFQSVGARTRVAVGSACRAAPAQRNVCDDRRLIVMT